MNQVHHFDLEAYKARIGFQGDLEPTFEVLSALARHHVCSIPFENLDVLLGRPIGVEPVEVEQKLVFNRRGGYCFEQNSLMLGVLSQIGFDVKPLSGRVRIDAPIDFLPPRTHLFLVVTLNEVEWIFDAGVGGMSLTSPIRFQPDIEQETLHETRRIINRHGVWIHQARFAADWADAYEFTGELMPAIDREVANWWTSTCPNAKFSKNLFSALALPNGERIGIANDRFTRRKGSEVLEQFKLGSADHLLSVLAERFGLHFPAGTKFGAGKKPWPTE